MKKIVYLICIMALFNNQINLGKGGGRGNQKNNNNNFGLHDNNNQVQHNNNNHNVGLNEKSKKSKKGGKSGNQIQHPIVNNSPIVNNKVAQNPIQTNQINPNQIQNQKVTTNPVLNQIQINQTNPNQMNGNYNKQIDKNINISAPLYKTLKGDQGYQEYFSKKIEKTVAKEYYEKHKAEIEKLAQDIINQAAAQQFHNI